MNLHWELHEEVDPEKLEIITGELQIPDVIARILLNRGISTPQRIKEFFEPELCQLHDPFLMKDMDKAVERTIKALSEKQRIFIYGDYDVDGITSVSMLYLYLKDMGGTVRYYIPNRQSEGYGISQVGITEAINWKADLIISVDCGITSINEVETARSAGIDTIISDHHEPGETLPPALAVLDPKQVDCRYPFSELAGVGVAYKLAQGISASWGLDSYIHEQYIELAALGSAADIVPLVDENRVLVKKGLGGINYKGSVGISSLIEIAGLKGANINVGHIVFGLAPRLNAVGRLGNASIAVELMTTRDTKEAHRIARMLEEENRRRKSIDNKTLTEAREKISREYDPVNDRAIILAEHNWHPGVIGIVASRIIEQYYRPTIMITIEGGIGKGSARSIPGFDIYSALKECSDLLVQFGGHKYAAGLTIKEDKIPAFSTQFKAVASEMIKEDDLVPKINIDAVISLDQITPELMRYLEYFQPYGPKNQKPLFLSHCLYVIYPRLVGVQGQHLRFTVRQNGAEFDVIGFNMADRFNRITYDQRPIDMVFGIEKNEWMNRVSTQLQVKDLR
ncbi:MAG: single-stranded-DNA-specific exonuclease RecJ [candidate division Zixibacteria bacterium]|nr:single-stranded-DNA-specific exonuclease RecJ [Candidatus Tariuqbacter arcticus]